MKRKIGKLSLKKQTVSNLSHVELNGVKGGTQDSGSGCTVCIDCYIASDGPICIAPSAYNNCNPTTIE